MPGEVPSGWERSTLGRVAEVILGQSPPSALCNGDGVGLPFFQGNAEFGPLHPIPKQWIVEEFKVAEPTDVLLSVRAPVGELNITLERCVIGRGLAAIRGRSADPRFMYYLLHERRHLLDSLGQGSTFEAINGTDLRGLPVVTPPLPEQKKIAAILSSVDEAIQATQAVIDQTRRVKEGLLQDLLTRGLPGHTRFKQTEIGEIPESWEVGALGSVCEMVTSGPRGWATYYAEAGDVFLRSQNIRNGFLDWSDKAYVDPPTGAETERARLAPGDILITITGNSVGNVSLFPGVAGSQAYASQHVGVVRLQDKGMATFFAAYLSPDGPGQKQLMKAFYGQSKPGLSLVQLRDLRVPTVPPEERRRIEGVLDSMARAATQQAEKLTTLLRLKAGLLQDLLTGKVRVTQ
ncbi:MAG: restriction endonuclease subunit S [Myxococcota bacterium]